MTFSVIPNAFLAAVILISGLAIPSNKFVVTGEREDSLLYQVGEMTGLFLKTCLDISATPKIGKEFLDVFQNCLRRRSLLVLDRTFREDVINVGSGIQIVRYREGSFNQSRRFNTMSSRRFVDQMDWNDEVFQKLFDLFDTHELRIDLSSDEEGVQTRQPRGRRRKDNMMVSLLVFAIVAVGLIVIPMGFQFLAVLGGKALLLAKLSLILSSIQGLKKIATSSFNYGLYSHSAPGNPWDGEEKWNYPQFSSSGHTPVYNSHPQSNNYGPYDQYHNQMMHNRNHYKRNDDVQPT